MVICLFPPYCQPKHLFLPIHTLITATYHQTASLTTASAPVSNLDNLNYLLLLLTLGLSFE